LSFLNVYNDARRADAYATLEFPGTWLAFRDLPEIIAQHVTGPVALDFGCGAGRSTRFLKRLGFDATGVDVSASMIEHARNASADEFRNRSTTAPPGTASAAAPWGFFFLKKGG
jgi:SAM-dependent methyltransferase